LDQEGHPLDEYEEYIEMAEYSDEDEDVVYIRAGRETDPSEIEDLIGNDADTSGVSIASESSTLVGETSMDGDLEEIPRSTSPHGLLLMLCEEIRLQIYCNRKEKEEPNWTPHYVVNLYGRDIPNAPRRMLNLGYSHEDEVLDSEYLQCLAAEDRNTFAQLTGYRVPAYIRCDECSECIPDIKELIFMDSEGKAHTDKLITCQRTDSNGVAIRAIDAAEEPTCAYRSRLVRPVGLITRPKRQVGEDLCLAAYVTINGVKAYTLFDSGSTTDAVSPNFTRVANLPVKQLVKPVTLQLGCLGSRSKVNFVTETHIEFASIAINTYLDIANLDKYDSILGTLFLWKHGIQLDFETQEIVIHRKLRIPALPEGEGTAMVKPNHRQNK
jgi:hypothetical protein